MSRSTLITCFVGALAISGCAKPGPFLRVATATPAQFAAVEVESIVWYEFQPGDVVPFDLLFFGVFEGGVPGVEIRAKRPFYLVSRRDQPLEISFDGKTTAGPSVLKSIISVRPREDGKGGMVGWLTYMGDRKPENELKALIEEGSTSAPDATEGPSR